MYPDYRTPTVAQRESASAMRRSVEAAASRFTFADSNHSRSVARTAIRGLLEAGYEITEPVVPVEPRVITVKDLI